MRLTAQDAMTPGLLGRIAVLAPIPANAAGALAVFLFFTYLDPIGRGPVARAGGAFAIFAGVTLFLLAVTALLADRWTAGVRRWSRQLRAGVAPVAVPVTIRRRVLNAAMTVGLLSLAGWFAAGLFYLVILRVGYGRTWVESVRIFLAIALVGGPVGSALAFLVSEYHWRREIPLFFPEGNLERTGVLRVPVRVRLILTFLLTSILPLLLMVILDLRLGKRFPADEIEAWRDL